MSPNKYWADCSYSFGKYSTGCVLGPFESESDLDEAVKFKVLQVGRMSLVKYKGPVRFFEGEIYLKESV